MNFLKHLFYRLTRGWNAVYPPLDPAKVNAGQIPDIWRVWLWDLERDVSRKATAFYQRSLVYTDSFESLVQTVRIVDAIPGNPAARGTTHRDGPGMPVTMTLTVRSMNIQVYTQHELLHAMQYAHNELFGPLGEGHQYPGTRGLDHWPLMFLPYGDS